ncbi:MAG: thermonuclease family protein [Propioniciclava sp.]
MRWVILAGLILLAGCQPALQESAIRVRVVAVVDGDTLDAQTQEGDRVRVRLLGIDAPETAKRDAVGECGAEEARAALMALVQDRDVDLVQDARSDQVDRYGRRLGYIEVGGRDVGDELIRSGLVEAWWPRSATTPIRGSAYRSAQEAAQSSGAGSWAACPSLGR